MLLKRRPAYRKQRCQYSLHIEAGGARDVRYARPSISRCKYLACYVAEPFVVYLFGKENLRILAERKRYVEAQPKQPDILPSFQDPI
jgi:hypothetical protein